MKRHDIKKYEIDNKFVACPQIKYSPLVNINYCKKCKLHKNMIIISGEGKDIQQEAIICNFPRKLAVINEVKEEFKWHT